MAKIEIRLTGTDDEISDFKMAMNDFLDRGVDLLERLEACIETLENGEKEKENIPEES